VVVGDKSSTGDDDGDTRNRIPQHRRDLEIWRVHPHQRTVSRRVRRVDGSCDRTVLHGGLIALRALIAGTIDFDARFAS
jgi:hypothetical protein